MMTVSCRFEREWAFGMVLFNLKDSIYYFVVGDIIYFYFVVFQTCYKLFSLVLCSYV